MKYEYCLDNKITEEITELELFKLVHFTVNKFFGGVEHHIKDDLFQIIYMKMYKSILRGNYDSEKSNISTWVVSSSRFEGLRALKQLKKNDEYQAISLNQIVNRNEIIELFSSLDLMEDLIVSELNKEYIYDHLNDNQKIIAEMLIAGYSKNQIYIRTDISKKIIDKEIRMMKLVISEKIK